MASAGLAREQRRPPRRGRPSGSRAAPSRPRRSSSCEAQQRRGADAAAHEQRPRARRRAGRKPMPSGPDERQALARRAARPAARCPGPTSSSRKLELAVLARARVGEGARQVGPLVLPSAPAARRGQHVELARLGVGGPAAVERADQRRRRRAARTARHVRGPPLGRGERARLSRSQRDRPPGRSARPSRRCSSWSDTTSVSPLRLARIARCAALAPDIVVMQGMPRATAARRIS